MRWVKKLLLIALCLPGSISAAFSLPVAQDLIASRLTDAFRQNRPAPLASAAATIDINEAYAIQRQFVETILAGEKPAGFKAGLTNRAGQEKFGVTGPVAGVLLPGGERSSPVNLKNYQRMMLELEVGFVVARTISKPVTDVSELKSLVSAVLPVIEMPDLSFEAPAKLRGEDIIAGNVVAKGWLRGESLAPGSVDINSVQTALTSDSGMVMRGRATDVMGDQWLALQWLIHRILDNGWQIEPGQLLITGATGKMVPAVPGSYIADFGPLGQIRFSLE